MECSICKENRIGPEIKPFGGYLCSNEHLQCDECNTLANGCCSVCKANTKFLQMKFDSPKPAWDPLLSVTQSSNTAFPKQHLAEMETQSRLSEEQLSMKDSAACITECPRFVDQKAEKHVDKAVVENSHLHINENFSSFQNNKLSKFSFKEDLNESNNGDICEILANSAHEGLPTVPFSNGEQLKVLSAKVLLDFDAHNTVNSTEVVHNYLENYSPRTCHLSPAYNCQHTNWHLIPQPGPQNLEVPSGGVSDESDASLKSNLAVAGISNPPGYFIMQALAVPTAPHSVNMTSAKSDNKERMDMRMQKILETLREDAKVTKFDEKSNLIKMPAQMKVKEEVREQAERKNFKKEDKSSQIIYQLLNTHRAYCNAPVNNLLQEAPLPQFQTVPCSKALAQELLQKLTNFSKMRSVPARLLNIPRSPINCPESTCQRMIFVSDFCKHLVVDHTHLPMERIVPFEYKNFFLDARLFYGSCSKCHLLYLICDKINDLGSSQYKDFLPILVMTSRISLNQICGIASQISSLEYFLIWVTGIAPEEIPISVSLTVWSRTGRIPSCHAVYSGQLYSIRNSQLAIDVWRSGRMLLLSPQQVEALTNGGKEMLNVQLSVH